MTALSLARWDDMIGRIHSAVTVTPPLTNLWALLAFRESCAAKSSCATYGQRGIVEPQTFLRLSEVSADDVLEIVNVDHDVRVEGIDIVYSDKPCRHVPCVPACLLIGLAKMG